MWKTQLQCKNRYQIASILRSLTGKNPGLLSVSGRIFRKCKISAIWRVNHDTKLLEIALPSDCVFPVPIGHHVIIRSTDSCIRAYTPVPSALSDLEQRTDVIYLMIKLYPGGKMSEYIANVEPSRFAYIGARIFVIYS